MTPRSAETNEATATAAIREDRQFARIALSFSSLE